MKKIFTLTAILFATALSAQTYPALNIELLANIAPNTSTLTSPVGNKYSGCWGWYQKDKKKEYAISCADNGTYFIDVTAPSNPTVSAFVPGRQGSTWREAKTYKNYCYITCDDNTPNRFQIIDMQYLPDSVKVIHDGNAYFERGHTIWIDTVMARMYIGGTLYNNNTSTPMSIWSLSTPTAPVLLKNLHEDIQGSVINYVHDMYVRNDTIYASATYQGLQ
jgi:choice-of-anchor B domain-containing protein